MTTVEHSQAMHSSSLNERVMDGIQNNGTGVTIQGERINNLRFADDIDLIGDSWEALRESVRLLIAS